MTDYIEYSQDGYARAFTTLSNYSSFLMLPRVPESEEALELVRTAISSQLGEITSLGEMSLAIVLWIDQAFHVERFNALKTQKVYPANRLDLLEVDARETPAKVAMIVKQMICARINDDSATFNALGTVVATFIHDHMIKFAVLLLRYCATRVLQGPQSYEM